MNSLVAAMATLMDNRNKTQRTCWEFCECHAADRYDQERRLALGVSRKRSR
jgi:hypothetical protein